MIKKEIWVLSFYEVLCLPGSKDYSDELKTNRKYVGLLQKCHREPKINSSVWLYDVVKELVILQRPKLLFFSFCLCESTCLLPLLLFLICFITSSVAVTSLHQSLKMFIISGNCVLILNPWEQMSCC